MALIYIVEDDKSIQEIEAYALTNTGYQVKGYENGTQFFEALEKELPDLIILDVMLPDRSGISIVKSLREQVDTARVPILMVTAKTSEIDKVKGLDSGADDYMTKPFGVMELISRVKALLRRSHSEEKVRDTILTLGEIKLDSEKHLVTVGEEQCELTYKEYQLLKLLMKNAGIVTTRQVILDRVWGTDFEGESRTLDMHIKTLRQKLKDQGSTIKTVRNVGYIMNIKDV